MQLETQNSKYFYKKRKKNPRTVWVEIWVKLWVKITKIVITGMQSSPNLNSGIKGI